MSKNGSRIISFGRYRATDLIIFAVILAVFDIISFFAVTEWFASDLTNFFFSIAVPISLLVMIRWNWYGLLYAVFDGVLYCALVILSSDGAYGAAALQYFLTYGIGNAFIGLAFLMVRFMGYKRIAGNAGFSVLYALCGWAALELGRTIVSLCFGMPAGSAFVGFFFGPSELLSLAMSAVILLIMRKLDGMLENQRDYLVRLDKEKKERMRRDTFGDEPVEIDQEALRSLNKKGGDMF